jgi:hypothetical protein
MVSLVLNDVVVRDDPFFPALVNTSQLLVLFGGTAAVGLPMTLRGTPPVVAPAGIESGLRGISAVSAP